MAFNFCFGIEGFGCTLFYFAAVVIFFLSAIMRKQLGELIGIDFSMWGGLIIGELTLIISMLILGNLKWAALVAILGMFVGGFFLAPIFGDSSESEGGGGLYG